MARLGSPLAGHCLFGVSGLKRLPSLWRVVWKRFADVSRSGPRRLGQFVARAVRFSSELVSFLLAQHLNLLLFDCKDQKRALAGHAQPVRFLKSREGLSSRQVLYMRHNRNQAPSGSAVSDGSLVTTTEWLQPNLLLICN